MPSGGAFHLGAGILNREFLETETLNSLYLRSRPELSFLLGLKVLPSPTLTRKVTSSEKNLANFVRLGNLSKRLVDAAEQQTSQRKRKSFDDVQSNPSLSTGGKAKKHKKKWLPPLGPPEAESAAILGKRGAGAWGHTSSEVFSTLSSLRH